MGNLTGRNVIGMRVLSGALVLSLPVSLKAGHVPLGNRAEMFLLVAMLLGPPSLVAWMAKRICLHFFLTTGLHGEKDPWSRPGRQSALVIAELLMYIMMFWLGHAFTNGFMNRTQISILFLIAAIGIPLSALGHWLILRRHLDDLRPSTQFLQCLLLAAPWPIAFIAWLYGFYHK